MVLKVFASECYSASIWILFSYCFETVVFEALVSLAGARAGEGGAPPLSLGVVLVTEGVLGAAVGRS